MYKKPREYRIRENAAKIDTFYWIFAYFYTILLNIYKWLYIKMNVNLKNSKKCSNS